MINIRLGERHKAVGEAEKLVAMMRRHPGCCDSVWMASQYGYPLLSTHEKNAEMMKQSVGVYREAGIRVDLQISNTVGHGDYMKSKDCRAVSEYGFEKMVGHDGITADYAFCWNGKNFTEYIVKVLEIYADIQPDTIWFDDDLRMGHHSPVTYGCFCEHCMKRYNAFLQTDFSREELVAAISRNTDGIREKWVGFVRNNFSEFVKKLAKAVLAVSPNTRLAYQYGYLSKTYGDGVNYVLDAFRCGKVPPASRAGAGAYDDKNPWDLLHKQQQLSLARSDLPSYVEYSVPEIENLPDVRFGKSNYGTALESSLALAYGHTGLSYAAIMNDYEYEDFFEDLFRLLSVNKPYWETLRNVNRVTHSGMLGIVNSGWKQKADRTDSMNYGVCATLCGTSLTKIGLAESFETDHAPVLVLNREIADTLTDEEIKLLFERNVITDGDTVQALFDRGMKNYFPITLERVRSDSLMERIYGGKDWVHSVFAPTRCIPYAMSGDCEPLGELYDALTGETFGFSAGIVNLGKVKWAVFSYSLFNDIISSSKRNQVITALNKLSPLPAYIKESAQVTVMPRVDDSGKTVAISVLNISISPVERLTVVINNPASERFVLWNAEGEKEVKTEIKDGKAYVSLPGFVRGWDIATLIAK